MTYCDRQIFFSNLKLSLNLADLNEIEVDPQFL